METPKQDLTTSSAFADSYQIIKELGKGGMGKFLKPAPTAAGNRYRLAQFSPV
ncbi:MAG: hypothetical protein R6V00_12760 [Candidatus Aminicenantes bacterium]